mgnify:CR=1 FL=1
MTSYAYKPYPHTELYGLRISRMNMAETVSWLCEAVESGRPHHVVTVNPIMIMEGLVNPVFMSSLRGADLLVPDGTGVVWAANHIGRPVAERVPGIELMHELLREAEHRGWRVYLLGAAEDVIRTAAERLRERYPGLSIVGYRDGFFSEREEEAVVRQIREAAPHLLFVGRSMDKQEPWLAKYRESLGVPVMMGVGGSFDVISGRLKRAPLLWRKLRLEWLFRLLQEPSRYRRMLVLPKFMLRVIKDKGNGRIS